jgi:hypothetical protein
LWILHAGKYTLVPYYQGENTLFDVSPASVEIAVGHDFFKIPKPFEVTGFSVGGHVVDSVGNGIEGVKIEIDDMERATTDSQGYYKLIKVTSRPYTIQAKKQHYKFSSLKNFEVWYLGGTAVTQSFSVFPVVGLICLWCTLLEKRIIVCRVDPKGRRYSMLAEAMSCFFLVFLLASWSF